MVLATAPEAHVWQRITATLLDPQHLTEGLAAARTENTEARQKRDGRRDEIEKEVRRHRTLIERAAVAELEAEPGGEKVRALRKITADSEATINRLLADLALLDAEPEPGLKVEDAEALECSPQRWELGSNTPRPISRGRSTRCYDCGRWVP